MTTRCIPNLDQRVQSVWELGEQESVVSAGGSGRDIEIGGKPVRGERTGDLKDRAVAKVIEFYIPSKFSMRVKWLPPQQRGRVIEFSPPTKKSA
jgi:hypothetical protein